MVNATLSLRWQQLRALLIGLLVLSCWLPSAAHAEGFDQIMADNAASRPGDDTPLQPKLNDGKVELNLDQYQQLRDRIDHKRATPAAAAGPRVVLGAAHYRGEIRDGVLHLSGEIDVTLHEDSTKVIPLVGSSLVLIDAQLDNQPIGLLQRAGYHVWLTRVSGNHKLRFHGMVAANGPRGSVEYAFGVVRTPTTRISVTMPGQKVAPVIEDAVHVDTSRAEDGTTVHATLKPTTRIRLLGVHDFGDSSERDAKLYAESSSLLSVNEAQSELFTVIRYNILHASAQRFVVDLPAGFEVVEAAGVGGFRYETEPHDGSLRLIGQTAQPVRERFEISLRLRKVHVHGDALSLSPPHCEGVERQHGWIGVEVVGKLQLEVVSQQDLIDVDVRQLPAELVDSAVSPVLRAYRYLRAAPQLSLRARPLPELSLHNGSIDQVAATTVVADDGTTVTELKLTLRNRLRATMTLGLDDSARVRSVVLDSQPVKASRDDEGKLVLPLMRSRGSDRLEPFDLVVVWEESQQPLALWGQRELSLPTLDMVAAAVSWSVYLPGGQHYSKVASDIAEQNLWTTASWHKPAHLRRAVRWSDDGAERERQSAVAGALPVRFKLPVTGEERTFHRYWLASGETINLRVVHMRPWLWRLMAAALTALLAWLLAFCARQLPRRQLRDARIKLAASAIAIALVLATTSWLTLPTSLAGALVLAVALWAKERQRARRWWRLGRVALKRGPRALTRWMKQPGWTSRGRVRVALSALGVVWLGWLVMQGVTDLAHSLAWWG